jgi:hypothetical protein
MITYRTLKSQDDFVKARILCTEQGIGFPITAEVCFGAFDGDKLVGFSALRKVYKLEPLINVSGHGHVAHVLSEKVLGCASVYTDIIECFTDKEEYINLYEKTGFELVQDKVYRLAKKV